MKRIRVLLAEDHQTVRQALRVLLETRDEIEVIAEAPDGRIAVEQAKTMKPDVAVLDVSMPHMNGLAATRAIKADVPATAVVALSRHAEEAYVQEMLRAGASGYVLKQSTFDELLKAIHSAARGERYLDTALASRAARAYMSRNAPTPARPAITEREASVLRLMAVGHSNKEDRKSVV